MPANILNFPQYRVLRVEETEHDYHIDAEVALPPTECVYCQSSDLQRFGSREQTIRDLPMHGKRVGIYVDTRRFRCKSCTKTFSEKLPEVSEKRLMTQRLLDWIGQQSLKRTFASIAEETGHNETTIRSVFNDYVAELEQRHTFETPRWLGIDEIHLIKPRCVLTNVEDNTLFDMLKDLNKVTVQNYLLRVPNRQQIEYVTMDMWGPYRDAVKATLPGVPIVVDKFHVQRMGNVALETVRKGLRADLSTKAKRTLLHDRFVLLKRERDLRDEERLNLSGWTKNYPLLGEAYRLKEAYFNLYLADSPGEARARYREWAISIPPELVPAFQPILTAWSNWMPEILHYFEHDITNSATEALNGLIRLTDRLGRGYSFEALRAKMLFAQVAFRERKRPKFVSKREKEQQRQRALQERELGYGLAVCEDSNPGYGLFVPPRLPPVPKPEVSTRQRKNYGPDISTLARLLEADEL
ncbi:ISL3 family transposase [Undibacterium oligocarboniphilum]|uniref:ISL3 family transposase n=1 Tax=Undibacterium oligocarboniphilum TaxID=666702 RepID=A0A850QQC2_9BURK|nr:ISL3 family transposase [Undibacterium oligocarboniphilum]MBC3871454.1 ISL3 family transposase [Undibacterium oligocarboniphilum]NVO78970.1 ISL3 family transposase [Undibacterium oligocarboniphilum]